jgi:hypothetical protein
MRIRLKSTGEIVNLPPREAKHLVRFGFAELLKAVDPDRAETTALKSGEREQTRGKQPPPKRGI